MNDVDMVIVEDNNHDAEMIMAAIQEAEIKIKYKIFSDGAEAVKYFFDAAGQYVVEKMQSPKLILLDLKLPKINGLEVLKMLKTNNKTKNIPVIIFTSSNEEKDRVESSALGANSYIVKPSNADEFSVYIRRLINYWVNMNARA